MSPARFPSWASFPRGLRSRNSALLALLGAGLAVACARYDLELSRALAQPRAGWAAFGERYGELPGMYALALAGAATHARPAPAGARTWFARELPWLLSSIVLAVALGLSAYRLFGHRPSGVEAALLGASLLLSTRLWRRWLGEGWRLAPGWERARSWTLRLGIGSWLAVSLLKLLWGRVRYRDLLPSAQDFTPWYAPQGWSGHSSFPSGHAALGWLLLPSLLIWPPGSVGYRCAFALSVGWGIFVASSRVVIGAHYLSDVLFSSALAFGVMAFAPRGTGPVAPRAAQRSVERRVSPLEDGK